MKKFTGGRELAGWVGVKPVVGRWGSFLFDREGESCLIPASDALPLLPDPDPDGRPGMPGVQADISPDECAGRSYAETDNGGGGYHTAA